MGARRAPAAEPDTVTGHAEGARAGLLAAIREALSRAGAARDEASVRRRLAQPAANLIPARSRLPRAEQVALFETMARKADAGVERVSRAAAVAALERFLRAHNLPLEVKLAPDPELESYGFGQSGLLRVRQGPAEDADRTSVVSAWRGIAETGTLMLLSGREAPSTLNFMPENHVVVLPQSRVVGAYEEAWQTLRERGKGFMPRTVNFITGPSRTADIEQKIQMGAHGPRRVHILLIEDA